MSKFVYHVNITGGGLLKHPTYPALVTGPYTDQLAALDPALAEVKRAAELGVDATLEVTSENQNTGDKETVCIFTVK